VGEVFRTPLITDAVRVALLALAQDMDDDGIVSARRDALAERLGRSDRRIGDRLKFAIESGYLARVSRGQKNGAGKYRATIPSPGSSGHPAVPKNTDFLRTRGGPQDESLQDGSQVEEIQRLEDIRGSSREPADVDFFGTPEGPQEPPPPYKDRAGAHSNADRSDPTADVSGAADEAVVIDLFGKEETSLRSEKTPARKRASETPAEDPLFVEFYDVAYPRKKSRGDARKAWGQQLKKGADPSQIIAAAARFRDDPKRKASGQQYTPYPASWLRNEAYLDEPEQETRTGTDGVAGHGPRADVTNVDWSKGFKL
jgi:hypothetical protein